MWCIGNETLFMVLSLPSFFVLSTEVSFFFLLYFPGSLLAACAVSGALTMQHHAERVEELGNHVGSSFGNSTTS